MVFEKIRVTGELKYTVSPLLLAFNENLIAVGGFYLNEGIEFFKGLTVLNVFEQDSWVYEIIGNFSPRIAGGYINNDTLIVLQGFGDNKLESMISYISLTNYTCRESISDSLTYSYSYAPYYNGVFTFGGYNLELTNELAFHSGTPKISEIKSAHFISPSSRIYSAIFISKCKIYIFGGFNQQVLDDFWTFDSDFDIWTQLKSSGLVPEKRQKSAFCSDGNILFLFGGEGLSLFNDLYYYSVITGKWYLISQNKDPWPSPRSSSCMIYYEKKLYIYGGNVGLGVISNDLWVFDLRLHTFYQQTSSPLTLSQNDCFIQDSTLTIVSSNRTHKFLQSFNTITETWQNSKSLEYNPQGSSHLLIKNNLISIGGLGPNQVLSQNLQILDTRSFTSILNSIKIPVHNSISLSFSEFLFIFSGNEVKGNTVLDTTPTSTFLKLNISDILNYTICSPGTFIFKNNCKPCEPGFYSSQLNSQSCKPCPIGTYNRHYGASSIYQCQNCKIGSWNNSTGQSHCRDCPSNYFCPYGSHVPIEISFSVEGESSQPVSFSANTELYNYSSSLTIYLTISLSTIIFFSLLLSKKFRDKIHSVDIYTMKHNHKLMVPMYIKKTTLGGIFTVLFIFVALDFVIIYLLRYHMNNLIETRVLVPLVTIPSTAIFDSHINLNVEFKYYGGDCIYDSFDVQINGVEASYTFECLKVSSSCLVEIKCNGCHVDNEAEIVIVVNEENSFTSEILVNLTGTSSIPGSKSSVLDVIIGDDSMVFTGNNSTKVFFELTPTIFEDDSGYTTGYHINGDLKPILGSQTEEIIFPYDSQVSLYIGLSVVSNCLKIIRKSEKGTLELFSALIGTVFGLMSSIGGILTLCEKYLDNLMSWLQHRSLLEYYTERIKKLFRVVRTDHYNEKKIENKTVHKSLTEIEKIYLR